MKELFVPYPQSLELRELGFDEPCFTYYKNDQLSDILELVKNSEMENVNNEDNDYISAPTLSQVLRWFREEHNLHSEILLDRTTYPKYCFEIHRYEHFGNYEKIENQDCSLYRTFEEAQLTCLNEIIKLVKTK